MPLDNETSWCNVSFVLNGSSFVYNNLSLQECVSGHQHFTQVLEPSTGTETENSAPKAILFIFGSCALGAFVRTVFKRAPLPYTVILLLFGALFGLLSSRVPQVAEYTAMARMNPHIILHGFLPVLIFESAFAIEVHTFLKASVQIVLLAVPGLGVATMLTAVFSKYVFNYDKEPDPIEWNWTVAMMFGAIVSATDPIAVVAALKELGAQKQLALIIEGESLLNDGAAIVFFNVFYQLSLPNGAMKGGDMVLDFVRVVFGGSFFGFVMAKLVILWLVNIFNDALTEITITLAATYVTFYISEEFLGVSGVLAVVVLGVTMSAERTSISPEVELFLHRFWEMLAYLANTLIFLLVGVVITETAITGTNSRDWTLMLALYCAVNVIRAVVIMVLSPMLRYTGYGLTWRSAAVMTWGGLRGAVGLALALIIHQEHRLDETGRMQSKILLHVAGIVMLTLLINATTISRLLKILGMSDVSPAKRQAMAGAVRALEEVAESSQNMYKSDRFLADADWVKVEANLKLDDPYKTSDEEAAMANLDNLADGCTACPNCSSDVPKQVTVREYEDMRSEARTRILKAQKTSYWRQFEYGMLSREAVRKLVECVDVAADKIEGYINLEEIKKTWKVRKIHALIKRKLESWRHDKLVQEEIPVPANRALKGMYKVVSHHAFEITIFVLIFINICTIIIELSLEGRMCENPNMKLVLDIINYVFLCFYTAEATLKICGLRKHYFFNRWNQFDFAILALSYIDLVLDVVLIQGNSETELSLDSTTASLFATTESFTECNSAYAGGFSPGVLKVAKVAKIIRILRVLRSLRLVKGMIPQLLSFINGRINKKLRFGYDVGKGYVMGEEEIVTHLELMIDNETIQDEMRQVLIRGRLDVMRALGMLQKEHPGIAVSVKTQQATRRILNTLRDKIIELRSEGVLDEGESRKLELMVEVKMKKLLKMSPSMPPPPPERVLRNVSWIVGDELLMNYIKDNAELVSMTEGEVLFREGDERGGIYIIVSGLLKVDGGITDNTQKLDTVMEKEKTPGSEQALVKALQNAPLRVCDYLTTGSVIGEIALLTSEKRKATVSCETAAQLYHIPFEAIQAALELFIDEPSLEYRLWRVCACRIATGILQRNYKYDGWPIEKIKLYLEKSVVYLHRYDMYTDFSAGRNATFEISPLIMAEIILIHGVAASQNGTRYYGPCYIPNGVENLKLLPLKTDKHVFLIIPRGSQLGLHETAMRGASSTSVMELYIPKGNSVIQGLDTGSKSKSSLCLKHAALARRRLSEQVPKNMMRVSSTMLEETSSGRIISHLPGSLHSHVPKARQSMYGGLGGHHHHFKQDVPLPHQSFTSCDLRPSQTNNKPSETLVEKKSLNELPKNTPSSPTMSQPSAKTTSVERQDMERKAWMQEMPPKLTPVEDV